MSTQERRKLQGALTDMKKIMISSVLCVACILLLVGCAEKSTQQAEQAKAASESDQAESSASPSDPFERTPNATVLEHVSGADVLTSKRSNLLALSEDEAAWLDRHGYPTPAELDALLTYDIEELSSATRNRRSQKAAALLGHRKMSEGDMEGAWAAFAAGSNLGSLYARQQMAIVSAHRVTGLPIDKLAQADQGNLGVMVAQLEVARMLGDHRAQALIDRYATNFDWDYYGKHVLTQTAIFMDQYGEYARARGERVKGPDPRPNAEAWSKLQEDPSALVTVYTRGRSYP